MPSVYDNFVNGPRPGAAAGSSAAAPAGQPAGAPSTDTGGGTADDWGIGSTAQGAVSGLFHGAVTVPAQTIAHLIGAKGEEEFYRQQNAAYEQQYGESMPAKIASLGGEMLTGAAATAPLAALAAPYIGMVGSAAGRAALEGAIAGGGTNALMSPDQNPLLAAGTGALGGALVGGGLGALAGVGAGSQGAQLAKRLGFDLSAGERMGGPAKGVEDVTKWMPGSGAAAKNAEHTQRITQILGEQTGVGPVNSYDLNTLNAAKTNAGALMDQVKQIPVDVNRDPSFLTELANTWHAAGISNEPNTQGLIDHIVTVARNNNGVLPGNEIHNLISRGGPVDLALGGNRAQSWYAGQIKDALLDAAERASAGNPQFANFQQGRQYWKAIKTIENSIVRNPDGSEGMSWQGLKNNIFKQYDMNQSGPGYEMQDLARVLNGPLKALPESGTGRQNFFTRMLVPGAHAGEAAGIGALAYFNPSYVSTVAIPTAAGGMLGRAMRFGPNMGTGAAWAPWRAFRAATNPLAPRLFGPTVGAPVVNALTGQQGSQQ